MISTHLKDAREGETAVSVSHRRSTNIKIFMMKILINLLNPTTSLGLPVYGLTVTLQDLIKTWSHYLKAKSFRRLQRVWAKINKDKMDWIHMDCPKKKLAKWRTDVMRTEAFIFMYKTGKLDQFGDPILCICKNWDVSGPCGGLKWCLW